MLRNPDFDPVLTVVVEEPLALPSTIGGPGNVRWISRKNASLQLKVENETPGVLVLSQTFYPGWKARAGAESLRIERIDPCFSVIEVPESARELILKYQPTYLRLGTALAVSGALMVVVGILLLRRRRATGQDTIGDEQTIA